jgi:hypothetical protein
VHFDRVARLAIDFEIIRRRPLSGLFVRLLPIHKECAQWEPMFQALSAVHMQPTQMNPHGGRCEAPRSTLEGVRRTPIAIERCLFSTQRFTGMNGELVGELIKGALSCT